MSYQPTAEDAEAAAAKMAAMKKPTKPKNMFLRFSMAERQNVKEWLKKNRPADQLEGSGVARAKDVAHELGRRWKTLTMAQRDAYKGDYDQEVAAYEKSIKEYRALEKIVDTYRQNVQIAAGTLKPVKPHVPFMRYTRVAYEPCRAALEAKGMPCAPRDVAKVLGHQWSILEDESKKQFTEPYAIERAEYLRRLEEFRNRYGKNPPEEMTKKKKRKRSSKQNGASEVVVSAQNVNIVYSQPNSHGASSNRRLYAQAVQGVTAFHHQYESDNLILAAGKPVVAHPHIMVQEVSNKRSKKKEKRKYRTDPNRPKPPHNTYLRFCAKHRDSVRRTLESERGVTNKARSTTSARDITTRLGLMWSKLTDEEKAPYKEEFEIENKIYLEKLRVYTEKQQEESIQQKELNQEQRQQQLQQQQLQLRHGVAERHRHAQEQWHHHQQQQHQWHHQQQQQQWQRQQQQQQQQQQWHPQYQQSHEHYPNQEQYGQQEHYQLHDGFRHHEPYQPHDQLHQAQVAYQAQHMPHPSQIEHVEQIHVQQIQPTAVLASPAPISAQAVPAQYYQHVTAVSSPSVISL